jgi:glycerophosphoryl diester phosphodiesterase
LRRHTLKQIQTAAASAKAQLPTLDDVLARYSRSAFLNIEVKVRGIEAELLRALHRHRPQRGYLVSSFLPSVVRKLHRMDRSLPLGIICRSRWQLRRWKKLPVSFVVPHYSLLSEKLVERMHTAGKKVATWTVNDPRLILRVAQQGVDAVISDNTKLLVRTLGPS